MVRLTASSLSLARPRPHTDMNNAKHTLNVSIPLTSRRKEELWVETQVEMLCFCRLVSVERNWQQVVQAQGIPSYSNDGAEFKEFTP